MSLSRISPGRRYLAVTLSALLLAGCLGKGGTSTRYYLVDPAAPESVAPPATPLLAVELMDLEIPQYLERFQIATRTGGNGIVYAEYHQWGESLRKNLLRTMARNLALLLGTSDVSTPLNRSLARPDYRVQVHVDQFEQDVDGRVRLKARWQVLDARAERAAPTSHVAQLESEEAYGAGEFEQVVAAMTRLYGTLATQVAASIAPAPGTEH